VAVLPERVERSAVDAGVRSAVLAVPGHRWAGVTALRAVVLAVVGGRVARAGQVVAGIGRVVRAARVESPAGARSVRVAHPARRVPAGVAIGRANRIAFEVARRTAVKGVRWLRRVHQATAIKRVPGVSGISRGRVSFRLKVKPVLVRGRVVPAQKRLVVFPARKAAFSSLLRVVDRGLGLLQEWSDLPEPWQGVAVPVVGFVGRSLSALEVARGAAVGWRQSDGALMVGGQVVLAGTGKAARFADAEQAARYLVKQLEELAEIAGAAACLRGDARRDYLGKRRSSARILIEKYAKGVLSEGLEAGKAAALRAELNWLEKRA